MISSLRGRVLHLDVDTLVVDVGGVGFAVAVTTEVARSFHVGDEIVLHTHLVVREDALSLFGFAERDELVVFGQLLSVSGVGPKSALGILSAMSVDQISTAVSADDDAPFRKVSGIGPKTAKLIVVQLAGKLAPPSAVAAARSPRSTDVPTQVVQALIGLGWSERVAADAVSSVSETASPAGTASVGTLLRLTLAQLGPARGESSHG